MTKIHGELVLILFLISGYYFLPWFIIQYLKRRTEKKVCFKNVICLTFDDGPGTRLTPQILQILEENKIKATFFILGRNIKGRQEILKQIQTQGHQIASHGYNHLNHWKVTPIAAIKDIKKGWQELDKSLKTQNKKYPFRPPNGKLNIFSLLYLLINKVPICYWTIITADTGQNDKRNPYLVASIVKEKSGGVILAHDFDRHTDHVDAYVLDSLKNIIKAAAEKNLKFITFDQLINRKA